MARELHDQDAVRHRDAHQHHDPHQRHHVQRGAAQIQRHQNPRNPRRHRDQDDERIHERAELRNQDQVQQHHGQREANPKAGER